MSSSSGFRILQRARIATNTPAMIQEIYFSQSCLLKLIYI
jgi:hypothetical protein